MRPGDSAVLKVSAILWAVIVIALWFFGGMHSGWTRTTETVIPVSPLEEPVSEWRLTLGVDFVAAGLGLSGVLFCVGHSGGRRTTTPP